MPDIDLRAVSLYDARAVRDALARDIGSGYLSDPEQYAALVAFKAMLVYRIAQAEKAAASNVVEFPRLDANGDLVHPKPMSS